MHPSLKIAIVGVSTTNVRFSFHGGLHMSVRFFSLSLPLFLAVVAADVLSIWYVFIVLVWFSTIVFARFWVDVAIFITISFHLCEMCSSINVNFARLAIYLLNFLIMIYCLFLFGFATFSRLPHTLLSHSLALHHKLSRGVHFIRMGSSHRLSTIRSGDQCVRAVAAAEIFMFDFHTSNLITHPAPVSKCLFTFWSVRLCYRLVSAWCDKLHTALSVFEKRQWCNQLCFPMRSIIKYEPMPLQFEHFAFGYNAGRCISYGFSSIPGHGGIREKSIHPVL